MHLNLVSVGILMVMVGSAFAGAMQQHPHQLDPGAGLARTEAAAVSNFFLKYILINGFYIIFVKNQRKLKEKYHNTIPKPKNT